MFLHGPVGVSQGICFSGNRLLIDMLEIKIIHLCFTWKSPTKPTMSNVKSSAGILASLAPKARPTSSSTSRPCASRAKAEAAHEISRTSKNGAWRIFDGYPGCVFPDDDDDDDDDDYTVTLWQI